MTQSRSCGYSRAMPYACATAALSFSREAPLVAAAGIGLGCGALIMRIPRLARRSATPATDACAGLPRARTTLIEGARSSNCQR